MTFVKTKKEKRTVKTLVYAKLLRALLSLLKLLQKVSRNRRQKFVDTHFSHKLGFGAKIWRPWDKMLKHYWARHLWVRSNNKNAKFLLVAKILITSPPTVFLEFGQLDFSNASDTFG